VWPYFLAGGDIFAENARAKATRLKWNVAVMGHANLWRGEVLPKIMATPLPRFVPARFGSSVVGVCQLLSESGDLACSACHRRRGI